MMGWHPRHTQAFSKWRRGRFLAALSTSLLLHIGVIFVWRDQMIRPDHNVIFQVQLNPSDVESSATEPLLSQSASSRVKTRAIEETSASIRDARQRVTPTMMSRAATVPVISTPEPNTLALPERVVRSVNTVKNQATTRVLAAEQQSLSPLSSGMSLQNIVSDKTLVGKDLMTRCPIHPEPIYPASARRMGETGLVVLHFVIDVSGSISAARIQQSSGVERLDRSALDSLHNWRCMSKTSSGAAVSVSATQKINFFLEE